MTVRGCLYGVVLVLAAACSPAPVHTLQIYDFDKTTVIEMGVHDFLKQNFTILDSNLNGTDALPPEKAFIGLLLLTKISDGATVEQCTVTHIGDGVVVTADHCTLDVPGAFDASIMYVDSEGERRLTPVSVVYSGFDDAVDVSLLVAASYEGWRSLSEENIKDTSHISEDDFELVTVAGLNPIAHYKNADPNWQGGVIDFKTCSAKKVDLDSPTFSVGALLRREYDPAFTFDLDHCSTPIVFGNSGSIVITESKKIAGIIAGSRGAPGTGKFQTTQGKKDVVEYLVERRALWDRPEWLWKVPSSEGFEMDFLDTVGGVATQFFQAQSAK